MRLRLRTVLWGALGALGAAHHPIGAGGGFHNKGFSLGIRDSIMIAHSFEGEQFGPAQQVLVLLL